MEHPAHSLPPPTTNPDAVAELLDRHRPRLLAVVSRRLDPALGPRVDPEDVLQDALLRARRWWASTADGPHGLTYALLYKITLGCLVEAWRRETRDCRDIHKGMPWPEASSIQLGLGLIGSDTGPSSAAARDEVCRQMRGAMARLKEADREILWMRHYDELTFPEAAEALGISESAATLRYVRALRRLKAEWENLQLHPGGESREQFGRKS